jgi:Tfp pilus assembly protein PilW
MTIVNKESGFTVVELLIATTVFSTVLLFMTLGILQVTNTFFKGNNDANTQRVASSVLNTISQAIQFDGGTVTQNANTICIGSQQFSYWPGFELEPTLTSGKNQRTTTFIENTTGCTGSPSTTGRELLTDNMRLSNLKVTCLSSPALCSSTTTGGAVYQIQVRLVYGDDNLLYSPSKSVPAAKAPDAACSGAQEGEQFCAVSDISTVVSERI